jgi:YD repeat-containing protein
MSSSFRKALIALLVAVCFFAVGRMVWTYYDFLRARKTEEAERSRKDELIKSLLERMEVSICLIGLLVPRVRKRPIGKVGGVSSGGSAPAVEVWRACTTCNEGYSPLVTRVDVTDPNGNVRRVNFGPTGYTTSETYALGKPEQQTYTYAYYADNLLQSVTDPLGRVVSYNYDANGNITSMTQLRDTTTQRFRDSSPKIQAGFSVA